MNKKEKNQMKKDLGKKYIDAALQQAKKVSAEEYNNVLILIEIARDPEKTKKFIESPKEFSKNIGLTLSDERLSEIAGQLIAVNDELTDIGMKNPFRKIGDEDDSQNFMAVAAAMSGAMFLAITYGATRWDY